MSLAATTQGSSGPPGNSQGWGRSQGGLGVQLTPSPGPGRALPQPWVTPCWALRCHTQTSQGRGTGR